MALNRNFENELTEAEKRKREAEAAVQNYGSFNYARENEYNDAYNALKNRNPFKYDLNADALYKQYKDQYAALGKLAMQDTVGQASAMTGGYGNSYATTAGQQMYNQYMNKPNEMIPTLYGMALDKYNAEGNALQNQYNMIASDRERAYNEYQNELARLASERDYAGNEYNSIYSAALADAQLKASRSGGSGGSRGSNTPAKSNLTDEIKNRAYSMITGAKDKAIQNKAIEYLVSEYGLTDEDLAELYSWIDARKGYEDIVKPKNASTK